MYTDGNQYNRRAPTGVPWFIYYSFVPAPAPAAAARSSVQADQLVRPAVAATNQIATRAAAGPGPGSGHGLTAELR